MSAPRLAPARWRWHPAGMCEPTARRQLYRGADLLAIAWQNADRTWSWRAAEDRLGVGPYPDMDAAQRAARSAVP